MFLSSSKFIYCELNTAHAHGIGAVGLFGREVSILNRVSVPIKKASERFLEHVLYAVISEKPGMCELGSGPSPDTEYEYASTLILNFLASWQLAVHFCYL